MVVVDVVSVRFAHCPNNNATYAVYDWLKVPEPATDVT